MRFALVLTALATSVLVALGSSVAPPCPQDASALLLHASAATGPQPRWSGCFDRPRSSVPRPPLVTPVQVRGAVAAFEIATATRGSRAVQTLGAALALSGDVARAIATLTDDESAQSQPDGLSNLAAAHLLARDGTAGATHLILALEYASHASALNHRHPAALFNRALALDALGVDEEAATAWRGYLAVDPESAWTVDARRQLKEVEARTRSAAHQFDEAFIAGETDPVVMARLCGEAPQVCRQRLEESALPAWAEAWLAGDLKTADALHDRARVLAEALRQRGDVLDTDAIADLEQAQRANAPRVRTIALGLQAYGEARRRFEDDGESIPLFVTAESRFAEASTPLLGWARANRVYAEFNTYNAERLASVAGELHTWTADAFARGYPALAGRLAYLEALAFVNRAEYTAAEPLMQTSIAALEQTRERDHLAATYVLLSGARMRLGDIDAGWAALRDALACTPDILSARRRYTVLLSVSGWLRQRGLNYSAIELLSSARHTAEQSGQVLRVAESSLDRAKAYRRIGQYAAARADLEVARPDPSRNGRWGRGERARYEYLAGVAEVEADLRPAVAIDAATAALDFFKGRSAAQRVADLYLVRGRAHVASGDREAADADFAAGIDAYLGYRSALTTEQQRVLSQAVIWDLYEARLQLAAAVSPERAFTVAEQGRARALVESLGGSETAVVSPEMLRDRLRGRATVVYFAVLPRELLIWVIGPDGVRLRREPIARGALERTISALVSALQAKAPTRAWRPLAQALSERLIAPVADLMPAGAPLVIIPEGMLNRVPFAALPDGRSERMLVESHRLTSVPSATVLMQLLSREPAAPSVPATLLAVADPLVTGRNAVPLPGAEAETNAIARLYARPSILSRERATRAAFVNAAPAADVVHFAGHVIANPEYPLLNHLEFAGDVAERPETTLEAGEIAALPLTHTRLVVLAACTTAGGSVYRGEGVLSLARPFLRAGVPSVIATLWDIDDASSATFSNLFHQAFVTVGDPAVALQAAQVSARSTLPPATWAAFVLIGGPGGPPVAKKDGAR